MGIHNFEKTYTSARERVENAPISGRNKELILRFVDDLALENLSKVRLTKYCVTMQLLAQRLGRDFDVATKDDLKTVISAIQLRDDYSVWTKKGYKITLRRFYKWFLNSKTTPDIVDFITITIKRAERKLPSEGDLLTEDEVRKLIAAAQHPRDKAFVAMLWESGARVSEIGNLCFKNVLFDKFGTLITVQGKTGSRKIRLISSTPYLSTWMNNHPFREDKQAPLWINIGNVNHSKPMRYNGLRKNLILLAQRAGVTKRINPHTFRHSRATFMANHLTEFQMNQYFGWIQGSDMPSTYVHMSGKEVDFAVLKMNGIESAEKKSIPKLNPIICPRCDTINASESKHCLKCGGILDLKAAMELEVRQTKELEMRSASDQILNQLFKDGEVQRFLAEKLKELGKLSL